MGRIGLFGGTFDPPHTGHTELAQAVFGNFRLDKLIFIPAGNPPHKTDKKITDKQHRYKMLTLALSDYSNFLISDFDFKNEKPNYSYITIEHFKKLYPNDEIFFIVGADSYRDFPLWKNYPEILSACTFIVVNRQGADTKEYFLKYKSIKPEHSAHFLEDFSCDISSTELRQKLLSKTCTPNELPKGVMDYIKKHKLYQQEPL